MRIRIYPLFTLLIAVTGLSAASLASSPRWSSPAADDEKPIDVSKLPAAVQATARKVFGKLDGLTASQEMEHGVLEFEVEGKGADGMDLSVTCSESGQVFELERGIAVGALPGNAGGELQKLFPGATVLSACAVEKHFFEVKLGKEGKTREAYVSASGRVDREDEGEEDDGEEEDGQDEDR